MCIFLVSRRMQIIPMSSIIWSLTPVCLRHVSLDITCDIARKSINRINKTHWPFRQTVLFSWRGYFERATTRGESATISVVGKTARVFDSRFICRGKPPSKHLIASLRRTLADVFEPKCSNRLRFLENNTRGTKIESSFSIAFSEGGFGFATTMMRQFATSFFGKGIVSSCIL